MITWLVRAGKKVGITALSHKVIRNLLEEVVRAAEEEGTPVRCAQKVTDASDEAHDSIVEITDNAAILDELRSGAAQVAAGTAWLWAREEFFQSVDVLFVDEAGQLTLPDVLAVSPAARSLVLLGDPQQLGQPLWCRSWAAGISVAGRAALVHAAAAGSMRVRSSRKGAMVSRVM